MQGKLRRFGNSVDLRRCCRTNAPRRIRKTLTRKTSRLNDTRAKPRSGGRGSRRRYKWTVRARLNPIYPLAELDGHLLKLTKDRGEARGAGASRLPPKALKMGDDLA